jgi:hypothetical protein
MQGREANVANQCHKYVANQRIYFVSDDGNYVSNYHHPVIRSDRRLTHEMVNGMPHDIKCPGCKQSVEFV